MKNIFRNAWSRCAILFILSLTLNSVLWRLFPGDDPEGGNLLLNAVMAGIVTAGYALSLRRLRKNRRHKEEVQRRLKQQ